MTAKAKESSLIQKARKKIQERIKAAEKQMNPETLSAMSNLIKMQLNRRKADRIDLKERQITTLEEKTHSAKIESQFILKLMNDIKNGYIPSEHALEGRIKTLPENNP